MPIDYFGMFGKSSTTGSAHINLTMSGLVAAQGAYVYFVQNPGSKPALIMGLAFGGIYGLSGYLINENKAEWGHGLGFALSAGLAMRMGDYAMKSRVFFPRGLMAVFATGATLYNARKLVEIFL
mmetsp:Transcript_26914/g.45431  ORF Transcript_26914/g.45431 Transcript_26914/m.45431 type:complete len:124 (-) Transcript_26914:192-563(-)|eukprot:CAMPEP_0114428970 /NCGR_PEP_ID=MMETSP0103-20121206/9225_1 /TAXON_ID=37642 ORGANISM="Paraphysomonas imperforata, Strain PA2" /NCGR_SAMPLE_ID=MMETSP0103 /ASSEMBLY_ACC=CAM_ASM_000201 /LENGTH=123 /DNA_ID=CAMNT_0001598253 /DNA_START=39 /DNA_END=410 /DNA_ORIENTATION=+